MADNGGGKISDSSPRRSSEREKRENGQRRHRHSSNSSDEGSRRHKHKSSHRSSESRHRHSRERSHRHRDRHSSHRSSRDSRHRRSPPPRRRSRSPRKSRTPSPPAYNRALDAQERLARRLDRAREIQRRKEEFAKKEERSTSQKLNEAVKKATQMVTDSTVNVSYEGMSAAAAAHVEALRAKVKEETGIEVPAYYNPLAINPMNYAQQAAKRKKLWAKKDDDDTSKDATSAATSSEKTAIWSGVKFSDNKSNEKFAKLMGIKGEQASGGGSQASQDIVKKQAEVFQNLDMQYQQARLATHTQRGLGLGFSSNYIDPNMPGASK